jgi:DNA topoisomerase IB
VDVRSSDINDYIQEHIGDGFTAKDFRTWVGTVLAAAGLAAEEAGDSSAARRRVVAGVVRDVAEHLGNTPAVARSAYIDPRVVERFEAADTVEDALVDVAVDDLEQGIPEELEAAVLDLIDRARRRRSKRRGRRRS